MDKEAVSHIIFHTCVRMSDEGCSVSIAFSLHPCCPRQRILSLQCISPSKCFFLRAAAWFSFSSHSMHSAWVIRLSFIASSVSMLMNLQPRFLFGNIDFYNQVPIENFHFKDSQYLFLPQTNLLQPSWHFSEHYHHPPSKKPTLIPTSKSCCLYLVSNFGLH